MVFGLNEKNFCNLHLIFTHSPDGYRNISLLHIEWLGNAFDLPELEIVTIQKES
jgi:hypothetical protein